MGTKKDAELRFLRSFYYAAGIFFGPVDSECYRRIKERWLETNDELPEGYELQEESEDA